MQLFSADATISLKLKNSFVPKNMEKPTSKVAHNRPVCFEYCQPAQDQPKYQFMFHNNCSSHDLCILTLITNGTKEMFQIGTSS